MMTTGPSGRSLVLEVKLLGFMLFNTVIKFYESCTPSIKYSRLGTAPNTPVQHGKGDHTLVDGLISMPNIPAKLQPSLTLSLW